MLSEQLRRSLRILWTVKVNINNPIHFFQAVADSTIFEMQNKLLAKIFSILFNLG